MHECITAKPTPDALILEEILLDDRFDWSLIRSFLAVLDTGSLLAASRLVDASQPTLSRHIAALEAAWKTVLFERTNRGLVPTEAALRLAEPARTMEAGAIGLLNGLANAQQQMGGRVRITASQPVACLLLPQLLAQMRVDIPQVQVELISSNAVSNLLRREADIALRMVRPEQASLITRRIATVKLGAYASPAYLKRRGRPRAHQDIADHEIITFANDPVIEQGIAGFGVSVRPENSSLRTDDMIAYAAAVHAGLGIGFLATYTANTIAPTPRTRQRAGLVRLFPDLPLPDLPVWLTVHREIRGNRRIRAVFDYLAEAVPAALSRYDQD